MTTYKFNSGKYKKMDLIVKKTCGESGEIRLSTDSGKDKAIFLKYPDYENKGFHLKEDTDYIIAFDKVDCALAYLCGNDDILEEGICFMEFGQDDICMYQGEDISGAYLQEFRNQFHFAPYKNWMNDPNGLCYYKGYYHMFYQYNPKSQVWDHMHWGHAVSKDLIHWTHLPIVLYPQKELYHNPKFSGGAFSGSAVIDDNDLMRLFLTRSYTSREGSWTRQWQTTCSSRDGINLSPERELIDETPEGVGMDFRDPMVCRIEGKWYMFLAGAHHGVPAVLCYSSKDLEGWDYEGPILKEDRYDYSVAECPDVYEMDGKLVIVAGFMNRKGQKSTNNRRDTRYYIGSFDDGKFKVESSGLFDYGKDCYAVQSFVTGDVVISIGWNSDDDSRHIEEKNGSNGTMSIPRKIHIKNDKLFMYPIKEIETLNKDILYSGSGENFVINKHGDNLLRLDIDFSNTTEFEISLVHNSEEDLLLVYKDNMFNLIVYKDKTKDSITQIDILEITSLTVLLDRSLVEVFINKGEYAATRRYYYKDGVNRVKATFSNPHSVKEARLHTLNSIW